MFRNILIATLLTLGCAASVRAEIIPVDDAPAAASSSVQKPDADAKAEPQENLGNDEAATDKDAVGDEDDDDTAPLGDQDAPPADDAED